MLDSGKYQGLFGLAMGIFNGSTYGLAKTQTMAPPNSPCYFPESSKNPHDYI